MKAQFDLVSNPEVPFLETRPGSFPSHKGRIEPGVFHPSHLSDIHPNDLLTQKATIGMANGSIPDLAQMCFDLYRTLLKAGPSYNAVAFMPVLKRMEDFDPAALERFLKNPESRQVLVQNELLKVVLIHWAPGQVSDVHGHPRGGCVFRVLQGSLEEKRFSPDASQQLLAVSTFRKGSMAYIDDDMAWHAVGNPYDAPAISLHAYTPGYK